MSSESSPWDVLGDLDEFGSLRWDQAPLHRSAAADFDAASIISLRELDRMIASRHTNVRLFDRGAYVDDHAHRERGLRRTDERTWLSDPKAVLAGFQAGATIVIQSAHEIWAPIEGLTSQLATLLDAQVGATLFVSPPGSMTDWHVDNGHLFVLHLYGTKHWLIARDGPTGAPRGTPPLAVSLHPGDVIYVPRDFLHRVEGGDAASVHVSFYSAAATWSDLLKSALTSRIDALSNEWRDRNPVNPNWGDASRAKWNAILEQLMIDVQQMMCEVRQAIPELDGDALAPTRIRRPLHRITQDGAFLNAYDAFAVALESRLRVRPHLDAVLDEGPEMSTLRFADHCIELPTTSSKGLARILGTTGETFAPTELGLSPDDSLLLVRRLVAEGLLEQAGNEPPP